MPSYPASEPHPEPSGAHPAPKAQRPPRISASSPPYYLGIPARVWLAAMSGRKGARSLCNENKGPDGVLTSPQGQAS
jgi:hypothetical protein